MAREIELKYKLSPLEYRRLRRSLPRGRCLRFQNHFFDTPGLALKRSGIGFRLRLGAQGAARLTLKYGSLSPTRGLHRKWEFECLVPRATALKALRPGASLEELFQGFDPYRRLTRLIPKATCRRLSHLGGFHTTRWTHRWRGQTWELDEVRLGRTRYFELELESSRPQQARASAETHLRSLNIEPMGESRSKLARFFAWRRLTS